MPSMRRRSFPRSPREARPPSSNSPSRPLNPSELNVLRAQYDKEGEMVGVQTKFNYAWVRLSLSGPHTPR